MLKLFYYGLLTITLKASVNMTLSFFYYFFTYSENEGK